MVSDERERNGNALARYLRYSGLGVQFFLSVGIPVAVGIWLDRRLGTLFVFTVGGLALGFTVGTYMLYKELYTGRERSNGSREAPGKDQDTGRDSGN